MKYKKIKLNELDLITFKGYSIAENKEGSDFVIPSGAVFPSNIKKEKLKKVILDGDKNFLEKKDILFNTGGVGTLGRSAFFNITKGRYVPDPFVFVIRNNQNNIVPKYLFYGLQTEFSKIQIKRRTIGTTGITSIKPRDILSIELSFPFTDNDEPDVDEQKRIVKIIEEVEQLKKRREEANKKMEEITPALFVKMFGDPATNPMGWKKDELKNVCQNTKLINLNNLNFDSFKYIDISSIDNRRGVISSPKSIRLEDAPSRARQQVKSGDVIISTVRPNLKNIALVNTEFSEEICSTGFCILRPKENIITSEYLYSVAKSKIFTTHLMSLVLGANYPAVKNGDIKGYKIMVPSVERQKEFTNKMNIIEIERKRQEKLMKDIEILFNSIVQKAFSGKL